MSWSFSGEGSRLLLKVGGKKVLRELEVKVTPVVLALALLSVWFSLRVENEFLQTPSSKLQRRRTWWRQQLLCFLVDVATCTLNSEASKSTAKSKTTSTHTSVSGLRGGSCLLCACLFRHTCFFQSHALLRSPNFLTEAHRRAHSRVYHTALSLSLPSSPSFSLSLSYFLLPLFSDSPSLSSPLQ